MIAKKRCLAEKGFTLIEIMVVVVIISLLALFVGPDLVDFGPNMRVKAAARDLHSNLQKMKVEAIKRNREALITFVPVLCPPANATSLKGSYTIDIDGNSDTYDLPQNSALCNNFDSLTGNLKYKFTPQGLWLYDNDDIGSADFQIQNDRTPTRKYRVSVSIAGGISTKKI